VRQSFLVVFAVAIAIAVSSQNTPGKTFGGPFNDVGYTVCSTINGGFLIAGKTRVTATIGEDILIISVGQNGNKRWQNEIGWNRHDVVRSVLPVNDGYIMGGDVWEYGPVLLDICLMKIDLQGNLIWRKLYGTNNRDLGFDVIQSNDGGFYVMGHTRGYENSGDILLIKTNEIGEEVWRKTYGGEFDDYAHKLIQNEDGTILMFGSKGSFYNDIHANFKNHDSDLFLIKTDEQGELIWEKSIGGTEHEFGYSFATSQQDGLYLFGSSQSFGNGSFDMFLVETDDQGDVLWQKTYGGVDYDQGVSIAKNCCQELFLLGTTKSYGTDNSADLYLIKTDKVGNELWTLTFGGDDIDYAYKVIATTDSGCAVLGETRSFGNGMSDILFTKIDKSGFIEYFTNKINTEDVTRSIVSPNPMRSKGQVRIENNETGNIFEMKIISISGTQVKSFFIGPTACTFDVSLLPSGLYFYQISSNEDPSSQITGKLVIQ